MTVITAYNADGNVSSLTAINSATNNQTTQFVYGAVTGNLFAGLVQADGWGRALRRHPIQFFIYLVLTVALAVFAGFAALSGSAAG